MHFEIVGGNKLETLKNVVDGCFRVAAQRVLPAFSSMEGITAGCLGNLFCQSESKKKKRLSIKSTSSSPSGFVEKLGKEEAVSFVCLLFNVSHNPSGLQ
jgi:hypothetical protein